MGINRKANEILSCRKTHKMTKHAKSELCFGTAIDKCYRSILRLLDHQVKQVRTVACSSIESVSSMNNRLKATSVILSCRNPFKPPSDGLALMSCHRCLSFVMGGVFFNLSKVAHSTKTKAVFSSSA